jgi:hydroxymethylpyrimidine/phosphomethylpyrimidine kinase
MEVTALAHLEPAARALYRRFKVPILVKGGHLQGNDEAIDCLFDGSGVKFFKDRFLVGINAHGTGCTLSAAIAVYLMRGYAIADAVGQAKAYLQSALAHAVPVGKSHAMNHAVAPLPLTMH